MKLRIILAGIMVAALSTVAYAQQPIVIKLSHVVAVDTPKGKAALQFKKFAEERSKGRVRVEVYANSMLYKDKEELEALQLGSVQMLAPSLSKFGPMGVKDFEAFELPYLFDDYADMHKVTQGPLGQQMLKKLESKGIVGLAYWDNGFRQLTANKQLKSPNDCRGLKMRIVSAKITDAYMRALGAIPQVMSFGEVYQAMQTGVVDGGENTFSNIYTQKMYEVQKHLTVTNHGYLGYAVIANKRFWDGLPADIRAILESSMRDATKYNNDIAQKENNEALAAIKKSGKTKVTLLTPQERLTWKKALVPVHKQMEGRIGKDLIKAIYKETNFDPARL
ncbi:TRAP transporter substrate-binding protein [Geomonas propionica]|uniref:TRAP transporter substrate-binding protein n=1 Tax=Geomonas propionica TaxID=2798582 RepID=A0ABS0YPG1_9BACT|nr:TRAP transporter substrate-binding protein [Geomonas propionica]MBJ6799809.1 TRAP transporter substrate-binding protein [Geomonas propionica]